MGSKKKSQLADDLADALLDDNGPESDAVEIDTDQVQLEDIKSGGDRQYAESKQKQDDSRIALDADFPDEDESENSETEPTKNLDKPDKTISKKSRIKPSAPQQPKMDSVERIQHMQIAQERILELEAEMDRLRLDNDELQATCESLKNRIEEANLKITNSEKEYRNLQEIHVDEKKLSVESNFVRDKELDRLKSRNEELEKRLVGDLKRVRVRERELENRLEIIKSEHAAVIRSKTEMILNVKRQADLLSQELEAVKQKNKGVSDQFVEYQDRTRRAVKALRLALALLNGEDLETLQSMKKAE